MKSDIHHVKIYKVLFSFEGFRPGGSNGIHTNDRILEAGGGERHHSTGFSSYILQYFKER